MQKPVEPVRESKYLNIGNGYASQVENAVSEPCAELGSRIQIVPYTSSGVRDVLGLNVVECLEKLKGYLTDLKPKNYEAYCNTCDDEAYDEAMSAYRAALSAYEASLRAEQNENK